MQTCADGLDTFLTQGNATNSQWKSQMGDAEPPAKQSRGSSSVPLSRACDVKKKEKALTFRTAHLACHLTDGSFPNENLNHISIHYLGLKLESVSISQHVPMPTPPQAADSGLTCSSLRSLVHVRDDNW